MKAANPSLPANSQYSVDEKGNLTITYPDGSKDKIAAAYLVNPAAPVVAPTVEIPYSNKATKEVYVYGGEENSFDIKFKDDSGKIASATVKQVVTKHLLMLQAKQILSTLSMDLKQMLLMLRLQRQQMHHAVHYLLRYSSSEQMVYQKKD